MLKADEAVRTKLPSAVAPAVVVIALLNWATACKPVISAALKRKVSSQKAMNALSTDQSDVVFMFILCEAIAANNRDDATVSCSENGDDADARCVPMRDDALDKLNDCEASAPVVFRMVDEVVMLRTDEAIDWKDAILVADEVKDVASSKIA